MKLKLESPHTSPVPSKITLATEKEAPSIRLSNVDLKTVSESLASQLALNFSHLLGQTVHTSKYDTELISSSEYLLGLPDPCCISSFQIPHSDDLGILTIDAVLVQTFLQSLLSKSWQFKTHLSEIELSVLRQIMQNILRNFSASLERDNIVPLKAEHIHFSPSSLIGKQQPQLSSCLSFSIKTQSSLGRISLCLPHKHLPSQSKKRKFAPTQENSTRLKNNIAMVDMEVTARLAILELTGQELLNLENGSILWIKNAEKDRVDVTVGGVKKFHAKAGLSGNYKAIKIY